MVRIVNRTGIFMRQLTQNQEDGLNAMGSFVVSKMREYAAVDTGYMKSRCEYLINRNELTLMNDAPYAGYQENGTYKMKAHPFFKPAVFNHLSEIRNIEREYLSRGL